MPENTEVKDIPSKGTRLKYNLSYVKALTVICAALLVAIMFNDFESEKFEQIKWVLVFGFTGAGGALGIWTASENGVKRSIALMNRG